MKLDAQLENHYFIVLIRHKEYLRIPPPKDVPVTITWAELRQQINDLIPDDTPISYVDYDAPKPVSVLQLKAGAGIVTARH